MLMMTIIMHNQGNGGELTHTLKKKKFIFIFYFYFLQTLITENGGCYFSSELLAEVDDYMQDFTRQRMQQLDVAYSEALQSTRTDIVKDRAGPGFFRKLLDIVSNRVLPVLKTLIGDAVALGTVAVATYCSVM